MTLAELINQEAKDARRNVLIAASLAGISNAGVLAIINAAAKTPTSPSLYLFGAFVVVMGVYLACARYTFHTVTRTLEGALYTVKTRVVNKIRRAEFQGLEQIGTAEIYDRITENVTIISTASTRLAAILQSLFVAIFGILYIATLSFPAFVILAIIVVGGGAIYRAKADHIKKYLLDAARMRLTFFEMLTDLLRGAKETKFSRRRGEEIQADLVDNAGKLRTSTVTANNLNADNSLFGQSILFAMLGSFVFVLPQYLDKHAAALTTIVATTLFIFGPIGDVTAGYPLYMQASVAMENIDELERKLDEATAAGADESKDEDPWGGRFQTIEARGVQFHYPSDDGEETFQVGPLSLTITAGEVVFIVGGNGSGKSTFLRLLTGLYRPMGGAVRVDEVLVTPRNMQAYRELISAVFADFHLFRKLYGLSQVNAAAVQRLLAQMDLDRKTSFAEGRFTTLELSTGQRKRLALIVALLEDRPLYVFDEWAADQDPHFRKYFYEELLPELKQRGKTVIAVSHDDRYFHCADRVVTLEYGQIRSIESTGPSAPLLTPPAQEAGA